MKSPKADRRYMYDKNVQCIVGQILPEKKMLDKQDTHFRKYLQVSSSQRVGK